MGIWLELGIFLVILGFGVWQLYDVKKVIREREERQAREKAAGSDAHPPSQAAGAAPETP